MLKELPAVERYNFRKESIEGHAKWVRWCVVLLLLWMLPFSAHAADSWTKEDTYREVIALTFRFIDYKTTLDIARNPDKYQEANPILGKHPSIARVNTWFLVTTIIHPIISSTLPKEYRKAFQYISIGISGTAATLNLWSGLKVEF